MTETTTRKLLSYLRRQKCGLIEVRRKYEPQEQCWTILVTNNYNQEIYQWFYATRVSVRRMSTLVKSVTNW